MADDGAISELEAPVPVEGEGGAGVLQEVAQVENSPAEEGASGTEGVAGAYDPATAPEHESVDTAAVDESPQLSTSAAEKAEGSRPDDGLEAPAGGAGEAGDGEPARRCTPGGEGEQSEAIVEPLSEEAAPLHTEQESKPEPAVTELTDEEKLLLCVRWLERRIDSCANMKQTLSEESRSIISDFFVRSAETVLYAFVDKASGTVSVSKSPPAPGRCDELVQYFFKDSDAPLAGVPTVHQLQHSVFFGYLRMDNLAADLTSLVGQLGLQQVRNNKTWPTSITKDLVGTLERYMATMMDAANQSEGKTILYVPQDDLSQVEVCAADKDLCQRLEATVIHWTRQIKGLISGGQGKPIEDSPLGEIELWRRRCNDFSGLETQLKAPAVQQVVTVLELAKSSYLEPLQKLAMSIEIQTHEAKDNFQMLAPLVDPCTRLTKCQLTDMPSILEEVMCLVRAIWANSRFLNTSDSINGLLRKVSHSLVERCRELIDKNAVIQGDIAASERVLRQSMASGEVWRNLFHLHLKLIQHSPQHTGFSADDAASAAMSPTSAAMSPTASRRVQGEQVWDESRVFAQMDAFMQRCADLLEVCEWRSQFSYRLACDAGFAPRGTGEIESRQVGAEEEEEVDDEKGEGEGGRKRGMAPPQLSPAFGGSRAKEMYARLIKIRAQFAEHMLALEHLSYDPLDVKAPWHADFSKLKVHVKDLEVMLNNVIASSFETVAHTLDAFNLQEGFQHLATRDSVKRAVDKRSQDMVNMWAEDINWVKKSLDKGRKNPPRHMHDSASQYPYKHPAPPYAGAAAWARMLLARIQSPYLIISKSHHLTVTKEYCEVLEQYKTVELAIQTFIDTQYQDWQNHMEKVFRGGEDLMNSNLIRRNPETQLLEVTFPQQVALLFKEVEMWNRIGYSIPFVAMENCKDKDRINCVRCSVRALVMDYNRNLSALELWERKVFSDKLKAVDRKIGPAVTRITWNSKGVVDFCKDASKQCGGVKVLIDAFKEHTGSIVQSCREISNLNLVQVQRKRIYTASEFEAVQATHREQVMETLGRLSADIKQNLKAIYQLFLTDGADSLREWERYILRVDDSIEKALSDGCKKSLHGLSRAINGDKKTESQQVPFFSVQIVLDSQNRVACTPSSNELMQMINLCAKELIGMLNVVPRLRGLVEAEVRAELDMPPLNLQRKDDTSISTCIANDEEVTKVMIAIAGGMSSGGSKLQKQVTYWEKYKHIWDYDKAAFIRRYAKGAKMSFEEDIKRYKDFHKEVSLEESQTQIGFISIDYSGLKSTIIWHCLDWQRKFTGLLNELALKDLNSVFEAFASTTEKLSATPKNLNELAEAGKLLKEQMRDLPAVAGLFEPIAAKYKMLEKFEVDVESSEIARLESLEGKYEAFKHFLNTTEKNLSACKRSMKVDLEKGSSSFEAETTNMLNTFKDEAPRSGEAIKTADALLQLQTFRQRLEKNRETEEDLRKGMEVFDQKLHVNDSMTKVEAGIVLLEELWGMRGEWEGIWDGYKSGKFADLKTDSMEETAGKFMKKIMMKRKDAGSTPLWAELKTAVDRFRATMPLITDLGNEDLQPRHWQLLMDQIGQNFDHEGDDFTLERVIDLRLDQHSEFIGTISASASKEYQVEKAIMDVEETWNTLQLDLVPYRDRGHYRIKTVEDLYAALDDNSVNLGALKANKFGKPFMGKIVFWEKTLSVISETLEMCQGVQKQWMYLENIFAGSEDIRRQLPAESSQFETCDAGWMFVMKRMIMHSTAKDACTEEGILEKLVEMNTLLEKIQKSLDAYLETKRVAFPRFYFVSADDLLEILGQARDPEAVQPHLKKCFDAIKSLKMDKGRKHTEASAMNSPEGEFVPFQAPVVTEGPVEVWMLQIEWAMRNTMHKLLYGTLTAMKTTKKEKWIADWPGQLLITSGQILWTNECEKGLLAVEKGNKLGLKPTKKKWIVMLNKYAELIRAGMNKQDRSKTVAVVTIEVHARDVIDQLMKKGTSNRLDFEWISQLRLSWEKDLDKCVVCQISAKFDYGCEYLGNCGRLVITPLTDRAYMTLTTALHLKRGGNPQGPAGTGKTETVKDLGKAIAKYVIVFNCSDGLDYKSMGRMFSGLAQTGAWSCFDEFNRIDIEVLSVVAQQILSILKAVTQGLTDFNFEGAQIKLDLGVGIFVTMNPGYAGRTELPDNLKAILRPISMMVPDMALIGEIMLFSEGFVMAKVLSKKMTGLFDLMKEQMSKQDHYDYGLRNTKSILVAAGALKRAEPEMPEDILLYRTIRDMQLPKLIAEDVPLFNALNSDFFPGLEIPPTDYGVFQKAIESAIEARQMQLVRITIAKIIQTYEVKLTRHGNMLVGGSFAGKSSAWSLLQDTHGLLKKQEVPGYEKVKTYIINPKSLSDAELYGQYDLSTGEWLDGVLSNCMRSACADEAPTLKWLILDGPVDTLWIESMNTVLDDNKLLTLVSGERISMPPQVSLLFEVQDLAVASPATVSRAGMVYYDPSDFGWKPYVASWLQKSHLQAYAEQLQKLFDQFVDTTLLTRRRETTEPVPCIELNLVRSLCNLVESVFLPENGIPESGGTEEAAAAARMWFVFCVVWSLGGAVDENGRKRIDNAVRECDGMEGSSNLPSSNTMYEWMVDGKKREWVSWTAKIPETWGVAPNTPFYKILVPTLDTVRYSWVVNALVQAHKEILIVGDSGVGKTFIMQECLSQLQEMLVSKVNFSAQTSSGRLQFIVEGKVEKRMKDTFGPPMGKRMVLLIDDLNMPAKDLFGSQPPLELLRHWLDYGFWYDRQKQFIKNIRDIQLLQVMAYPGGGRSVITMRLQSRSNLLNITFPAEAQLKRIFSIPLRQKLESFGDDVVALCDGLTKATMNLYFAVCKELLPTPSKSHYLFNLRDMCKILQGLLQAQPSKIGMDPKTSILKLWTHECMRVFSDRLIDPQDTTYFLTQIEEQLVTEPFSSALGSLFDNKVISIYGDFMSDPGQAPKYEEYADFSTVKAFCEGRLEEYNYEPGMVPMQLVLFRDAIEHTCRIARVIGLQRGNAMLVGVGGSGRQSLSRLASFLKGYKTFMIEITKTYRKMEFHEDLKRLYVQTGVQRKETMFLFTDTQIVEESFLEDINGILSTGEVPNLYNPDEISEIREGVLQQARAAGVPETSDALYNFFIEQARNHMHVVLCFSPIGDSFRIRCRKFPGLVSCTSIDWFSEWPIEALTEVAFKFTEEVNLGTDTVKKAVTTMMATAQASVSTVSKRMFAELKRVNYVTPTNYLELVTGYLSLLAERRAKLEDLVRKYVGGVDKIAEAKLEVEEMSKVLVVKKEEVIIASKETEELLVVIVKEKAVADEQEKSVSAEAKKIGQEEVETKVIAQQAQTDLDKAIPALNAAADALNSLEKNHINETKSFKTPPPLVAKVLSAVLILRKASSTDWAEAKRHLSDMNFLQQLKEYDKDNMSDKLLQRIDKYMVDPEFEPEVVAKVSTAASGLCKWVRAMHLYGNVAKTVAPKREKLKTAMMSLEKKQVALKKAQEELQAVVDKVTELQSRYDHSIATKERLTNESATLTRKLERADQLVKGLSGERTRWEGSIEGLQKDIENSVGDCVVAAAFLSYAGAFNTDFRQVLVKETWMPMVEKLSIPTTKGFDFASFLAKPTDVREWNLKGLPGDAFSVENGVLVTRGRRWPLMVDPQAQANKWIKNLESDNGLKVVDLKMSDWMRTMENAIQFGSPVLIQDVLEELDPALEPVLSKSFTKQGNRLVLKLGDKEIDYNEDFKLYLTTKLGNPHYPPEVSTKTTIVNFAIKREGLEDQLLGLIVKKERPDLEEQNQMLVVQVAKGKNQLAELDDKILYLLSTATGSLLDDDELVTVLQSSKTIAIEVTEQLRVAEETKITIDVARESYRPSAFRASILYFVLNDMGLVDPMYQFALESYVVLFLLSIAKSPKSDKIEERLKNLNDYHTFAVYQSTCRGLFERHKLLFSLHTCAKILEGSDRLNREEYTFLLRGGQVLNKDMQSPNPAPDWITETSWDNITELANIAAFRDIDTSFENGPQEWNDWFVDSTPEARALPGDWQENLNELQRLCVIRSIRPDRVVFASTSFITNNLGSKFVEPPPFDLSSIYAESTCSIPLIFILSPGVDPVQALFQVATQVGAEDKLKTLALGQGQAPIANRLLADGTKEGHWVFLANCHLMLSWMNNLEKVVEGLVEASPHKDFRLWLSSYPHPKFPISILQAGTKMVTEPPKGLKANMTRLYNKITPEQFSRCSAGHKYRRLLFCLVFFHAALVERKKFGTLGYNVPYDFNESDFDISEDCLAYYLANYENTPWEALRYLIAEANYGGRVTDEFDFRLVRCYVRNFFQEDAISGERFLLAPPLEHPRLPEDGGAAMKPYADYIKGLAVLDDPQTFGQHSNADISAQISDTSILLDTLSGLQPATTGGDASGGGSGDDRTFQVVTDMEENLPEQIDFEQVRKFKDDDPSALHVFLLQEIKRYNKHLENMAINLADVKRGIKGLVVMSAELDEIVGCVMLGKVPPSWNKCFPSLKPLANWLRDLQSRVTSLRSWGEGDYPTVYWMSGFSYPTGFLTAILQTAARASAVSVDILSWEFTTLPTEVKDISKPPKEGAYIHGMFLEGAAWDMDNMCMQDQKPMELVAQLPVIHFRPVEAKKKTLKGVYSCPAYMYPVRTGSRERPSYTISIDLKAGMYDADFWIRRGAAILLSLAT